MKELRNFLLLLVMLLTSVNSVAEDVDTTIRLYTENFGRFNYSLQGREFEHREENIGGSSAELIKKMMAETQLPYRTKLRAWSVSYERALLKPYNGVFSTSRTESREELFYWIGPIGSSNTKLYKKKDRNIRVNSLDDLKDLRVGGYKGDASTIALIEKGIDVIEEATDAINPKKLDQELIDIWVASDASAAVIAEQAGYPDIEPVMTITTMHLYLAMNKSTPIEVINILQAAYDKVVAEYGLEL